MKYLITSVAILLLFLATLPVSAQKHETFAENPGKRQETVKKTHDRAHREKEQARQWAEAHGMSMRDDNGVRTMQLMGIRGNRHIWYTTENYNAAISTAANQVRNTAPFNADGSGLTVGVWDTGSVMTSHQEFGGRVSNMDSVASYYHSTHVGGTIGAAGVALGRQGMAPAVNIDSYDWNDDIAEMNGRAAASPGESGALYLSNHSYGTICGWHYLSDGNSWSGNAGWHWPYWLNWGAGEVDPLYGQYDSGAMDYDQAVYDAPYFLPFVAAGNDRNDGPSNGDTVYYNQGSWQSAIYNSSMHPLAEKSYKGGYDTIKGEACAKNIMTVGAVKDAVSGINRSLDNADMTSFSGWGPADDGRIKPDIVANGWDVWSCDDDSTNDYINLSGTSMATPNACGSAALLIDYYNQQFPGQYMRASTLKGLIIHTADDLGNPGPDYAYGWGLMNTKAAAELIQGVANGHVMSMTEDHLGRNDSMDNWEVYSDGYEPLRITLCWTDPPAAGQTDNDVRLAMLVNDLDLTVTGPDGLHYPYSLDYTNPASNATASAKNNVDNVEQVYINAPIAGFYTITVDYDGSLMGSTQWYSLLVSGDIFDSDGDGLADGWEYTYFSSTTGAIATADSDGDGQDNLSEYISGHNPLLTGSRFGVSEIIPPQSGYESPFILSWDPVTGRVYRVSWSTSMGYSTFTNISGDLPYPANSYTDTVERAGPNQFYKLQVRLAP